MTKQEREMIAAIGGSLGSAAALLQEAAKEPVKATSESKTVEEKLDCCGQKPVDCQCSAQFPEGMFPPVVKDDPVYRRPKVVECKEVKVKAKPPVRRKDSPHVGGAKGGVRYEWSNGLPINYLTLNESGRGSNVKGLVFTPENTLIIEDYVQYKGRDGEVVKYGVSLVNKAWQKGRTTVVVFPVGNTLKGKRYVQEKNAAKLNGDIIEFKAEHLGMLQVMFRGATEANGLLANLGAALS